ncbi:tetratricopeptide repeat protein [Streptomyces sp. NPDC002328]|uniref:tetratricopeptide repeat protein n=1 Tax=Streptomyces sp. NPDC002328 TaxID=3364642 RepID=UPI0036A27EA7
MSRLSREKKREEKHAGRPAVAVAPLDVHVPGGGPATIGGVQVVPGDDEELQHAVLRHLHRIALATGQSVVATVHDERIGYVVPLRVEPNGSSHFTGQPLRVPAPADASPTPAPPAQDAPSHSGRDKQTHLLRSVPDQGSESTPTFRLRPVPEQPQSQPESQPRPNDEPTPTPTPTQSQSQAPSADGAEPQDAVPSSPGTVTAPTGVFGPPPAMATQWPDAATGDDHTATATAAAAGATAAETLTRRPLVPELDPEADADPDPKPTPARGFDAVAEAVLGDDPRTLPGDGGAPALLGEPMAQINEAVRAGRIDTAAALAERTVTEASAALGPEHPEVLRLRELTAYIAYLAGDPLRSFHLSLDLARIRRHGRDAEAAYGNVQSAATAWRAVRDPLQGLNLGTELLGLWTELTTEEGPAADDVEELESARARMLRLAERARKADAAQRG